MAAYYLQISRDNGATWDDRSLLELGYSDIKREAVARARELAADRACAVRVLLRCDLNRFRPNPTPDSSVTIMGLHYRVVAVRGVRVERAKRAEG